jgi:5-(carboxyamino)imidazole ribonucleotide mutase
MASLRMNHPKPLVGIIMGSKNDWAVLQTAGEQLDQLQIPYEAKVLSAHRTPEETLAYAAAAESRGLEVLIAGAGMAAALPGVLAAMTTVPVLGVPIDATLGGLDALLSIVQMPKGVPVGTLAVGKAGAANAALLAAAIVANSRPEIRARIKAFREQRKAEVLAATLP